MFGGDYIEIPTSSCCPVLVAVLRRYTTTSSPDQIHRPAVCIVILRVTPHASDKTEQ
jgi:hypothetical protein